MHVQKLKSHIPTGVSQIASRVLIGMHPAKFYVDTTRLADFDPRFIDKYNGEREVLGVGVADPDSVMIVKVFKPDGSVETSYVRSAVDPSIINVFNGDVDLPISINQTLLKSITLRREN